MEIANTLKQSKKDRKSFTSIVLRTFSLKVVNAQTDARRESAKSSQQICQQFLLEHDVLKVGRGVAFLGQEEKKPHPDYRFLCGSLRISAASALK